MLATKAPAARSLLAARLALVCGHPACAQLTTGVRQRVAASAAHCEVCAGSNNRRAARVMAAACAAAGLARLLIVGGTTRLHGELGALLNGSAIELRCIDGAERTPTKKDAVSDLAWAHLLVIWASTPLPHKVSVSYADERPPSLRHVTVARRGLEALCMEVTTLATGRARSQRARA
ncbi:MAG: hypothetical protein ACR2HN_12340 [Tepidiformaceae bacterium]